MPSASSPVPRWSRALMWRIRSRWGSRTITWSSRPSRAAPSHGLCAATYGGDAGTRHLDQAQLHHDRDELLDLGSAARDLKHEVLGGRVDHVGTEDLGHAK